MASILILDASGFADVLQYLLMRNKHSVTIARDIPEALEQWSNEFNVLVVNFDPDAKQMDNLHFDCNRQLIIGFSSRDGIESEAIASGFNQYYKEPFDAGLIINQINSFLS